MGENRGRGAGETGEKVGDSSVVDLVKVLGFSSALDVASKSSLDKKELASNEKVSFKMRPVELLHENLYISFSKES